MLKSVLFILISLSLFSCGTTSEEKLKEVILDAQIALGAGDCQYAIDVLEGHGRQNRSAAYLKTLSSAYACRAGYSTPTFFSNDLPLTATPAPLGGTTLYSTSTVATTTNPLQDDTSFIDLQTAIDILLYAGGISATTNPTTTERAKYFTSDEAGEINSQLLFMELAQLGKYMYVYGDGSATGLKASGAATNTCFTDYTTATLGVFNVLVAANGTCIVNNSPHSQLAASLAAATRKTRLCHGVVLTNGMLDVLPSVIGAATGGSLGAASGITTAVDALKAAVIALDNTTTNVFATMNQVKCEDDTFVTVPNIETYFAGMMEYLFL